MHFRPKGARSRKAGADADGKGRLEREDEAKDARKRLLQEGVEPQRISLIDRSRPQRSHPDAPQAKGRGLWANIKDIVTIPDEEPVGFEERLRSGGFLLTASVPEERLEGAMAILAKTGVVELATEQSAGEGEEQRIPIVEERLTVATEQVEGDSVRVHTSTAEKQAHERVQLLDYRVNIERRPVDQPLARGEPRDAFEHLFQERVIEMTETSDEVTFEKQARVREEVVVRREVRERVEQIDTHLRHTEVDAERIAPEASAVRER